MADLRQQDVIARLLMERVRQDDADQEAVEAIVGTPEKPTGTQPADFWDAAGEAVQPSSYGTTPTAQNMETVSDLAKQAFREAPIAIPRGIVGGVDEVVQTVRDTMLGGEEGFGFMLGGHGPRDPEQLRKLLRTRQPETTGGELLAGFSQIGAGAVIGWKSRVAGAASTLAKDVAAPALAKLPAKVTGSKAAGAVGEAMAGKTATAFAFGDYAAFPAQEKRMFVAMNEIPALADFIPDWIASDDPDDPDWKQRFERAVEGHLVGAALELGFRAAYAYVKARKAGQPSEKLDAPNRASVEDALETKAIDDFERGVQEVETAYLQPEEAQGRLAELQALKDEVDQTLEPEEVDKVKEALRPTVETVVKSAEQLSKVEGVDPATMDRVLADAQRLNDLVELKDVTDVEAGLTPEVVEAVNTARKAVDDLSANLEAVRPEIEQPALARSVDHAVEELKIIRKVLPDRISPRNRKELQQTIERLRAEIDPIDTLRDEPTVAKTIDFFERPLVLARKVRLEDVRDVLALGHEAAGQTGIARFGSDADRLAFEAAGRDAWDRLREWEANPQNAERAHRAVQAADVYRKAFRRQAESTRLGILERVETPDEIRARGGLSVEEAEELHRLEMSDSFASWHMERMAALRAKRDAGLEKPLGQPEAPPKVEEPPPVETPADLGLGGRSMRRMAALRAAAARAAEAPAAEAETAAVPGGVPDTSKATVGPDRRAPMPKRAKGGKRWDQLTNVEKNTDLALRREMAAARDMGAGADELAAMQREIDQVWGRNVAPMPVQEVAAVQVSPRVLALKDEIDQMRAEGADEDLIKQIEDEMEKARAEEAAAKDDVPTPSVREQRSGIDRPSTEMMVGLRDLARSFVGARFGKDTELFSEAMDRVGWEEKAARFADDMYRAASLDFDDPFDLLDKVFYGLQQRINKAGTEAGQPLTERQLDDIARETIAEVMPGMKGTGRAKERAMQEMEAAFGRLQRGMPRRDPVHSSGVPDATLNELRTMAIRIFGHKLHVEELTNAGDVTGQFDTVYNIARVALLGRGAPAAMQTLGHEGIHFLRQWKGFTDPEWDTLVRVAKRDWMKKYDIVKKYEGAGLTQDQLIEEAIAEGLGDILAGVGKAPRGVKGIANKVRKMLDRLAAKMRGTPTLDDVVRRLESGEIGREMDAKDLSKMLDAPAAAGDIRAVHGSGKLFRAFLDGFVNTGEGSQIEGWGHYFTRSRGEAEKYKEARVAERNQDIDASLETILIRMEDELPGPWSDETLLRTEPLEAGAEVNHAFQSIAEGVHEAVLTGKADLGSIGKRLDAAKESLEQLSPAFAKLLPDRDTVASYAQQLADAKRRRAAEGGLDKGHLYTVDLLGVNNRMIDFRVGFEGQPQAVQDGIRAAYQEAGAEDLLDAIIKNPKANGKDLYRGLAFRHGGVAKSLEEMESVHGAGRDWLEAQHKASKLLLKHGVEGNTFHDAAAGVDNFVLFSGDRAKILLREQRRVERGRGEAHEAALRYLDGIAEDRATWEGFTDEQRVMIENDDPELAEIWGKPADEALDEGYERLAAVLGTKRANEVVGKLRGLKAKDYRAEHERGGRAAERVRQDIDGVLGAIREQRGRGGKIEGDEGTGAVRTRPADTKAGRIDLQKALQATRDLGRRSPETGQPPPEGGPLLTDPLRTPDEVRAGEPKDFGSEKGDVHLARQRPARVRNLPPKEAYGVDAVPKRPNVRLENLHTAEDYGTLLAETMERQAGPGGIGRTKVLDVTHRDAVEGMIRSRLDPNFKLRTDIDPAVLALRQRPGAGRRTAAGATVWTDAMRGTDIDPRGRGGKADKAKQAARVDRAVWQSVDDMANTVYRLGIAAADNQADAAAAAAFARGVHKLNGFMDWLGGNVKAADDSLRRAKLDVNPDDANAKSLIRRGNHGLIKQSGGIQALRDTASGIADAKNTADVIGFLKQWRQQSEHSWSLARGLGLHRAVETSTVTMYNNQLSGAGTQGENWGSGLLMMGLRMGTGAVQGAFAGEFADAALIKSPMAAAARRLASEVASLPASHRDALKAARVLLSREFKIQTGMGHQADLMRDADAQIEAEGLTQMFNAAVRHSDSEVVMDGMRFGIPRGIKELAGEGALRSIVEGTSGTLGLTISGVSSIMKSIDVYVKMMSQRTQLYHDASTAALRQGLKGEAYAKEVQKLVSHPSQEMLRRARTVGELNTFQEDPGKYTAAFIGFTDKYPIIRLMLPSMFIRSPMNSMRQANEGMFAAPINAAFGNRLPILRSFLERGHRLAEAGSLEQKSWMRAQAMVGFAAWTVVAAWAANGNLTGSSTDNRRYAATRRNLGRPDDSIRLPWTNTWVTYKNWGVLGFMLGVAANTYEMVMAAKGKAELELAGLAAGIASIYMGVAMRESTLDNVLQITEFQDNPEMGKRWFSRYAAQKIAQGTVPLGTGAMARSLDRFQLKGGMADYDASAGLGGLDESDWEQLGEEIQRAFGVWRDNIWMLSKNGERYPRLDGLGGVVGNPYMKIGEDEGASGGMVTVVMSSLSQNKLMQENKGKEAQMILEIGYAIPEVPNKIQVNEAGQGKGGFKQILELPRGREQYYFYDKTQQDLFRRMVGNAMQEPNFKVHWDGWKVGRSAESRQALRDWMGRLWTKARDVAEKKTVEQFPELQDRIRASVKDLDRKRRAHNERLRAEQGALAHYR